MLLESQEAMTFFVALRSLFVQTTVLFKFFKNTSKCENAKNCVLREPQI